MNQLITNPPQSVQPVSQASSPPASPVQNKNSILSLNKKVLTTLVFGVLSLILLSLSGINIWLGFLSTIVALLGSFMGIWLLFSLLFKSLILIKEEKLYLLIGIVGSLIAFGLGKYGFILVFWLPGTLIGIFSLRSLIWILNKSSNLVMNPLQQKISQMEEELKQHQTNKNNPG